MGVFMRPSGMQIGGRISPTLSLIILYIVIPANIFLSMQYGLLRSAPALVLSFLALRKVSVSAGTLIEKIKNRTFFVSLLMVSFVCLLSGVIGLFHPAPDWIKHFAVFNVIRNCGIPSYFGEFLGNNSVMRYYSGFYIVPALISAILPVKYSPEFLILWMIIGFSLVCLVFSESKKPILLLTAVLMFSGLDIIGILASGGAFNKYGIEWWAGPINFPSTMYSILWAPQHEIPAIIMAVLIYKLRECDTFRSIFGIVVASVAAWSPFVAIGSVVLYLSNFNLKKYKNIISIYNVFSIICFAPLLYKLYIVDDGGIPSSLIWEYKAVQGDSLMMVPKFSNYKYVLFLLFDVLAPCLFAYYANKAHARAVFGVFLGLLFVSAFRIGLENDWSMRTSAPLLATLAIIIGDGLSDFEIFGTIRGFVALLYFSICSVSPFVEVNRAIFADFHFLKSRRPSSSIHIGLNQVIESEYKEKEKFIRAQILQNDTGVFRDRKSSCNIEDPTARIGQFGSLIVDHIDSENRREWDGQGWWLWGGKEITLWFRNVGSAQGNFSGSFHIFGRNQQNIEIYSLNKDGTKTLLMKKYVLEDEIVHFESVVSARDVIGMEIHTDLNPEAINDHDARVASYLLRDFSISVMR